MIGYIYKITNLINNKIYIGKTITSIAHRWNQHKSAAEHGIDWYLYRAMRKYGYENFTIEAVETVEESDLNEREIYWIEYYDSYNNGYNMTLGGEGRITLNRQKIVDLWKAGVDVQNISKELNCWVSSVIDVLKEQDLYDKNRIIKERTLNIANTQSQHKIVQYNETGEVVNIFNSCKEAANFIEGSSDSIHSAITQRGSRYGYYWAYQDAKILPNFKPIQKSTIRTIYQYSLQKEFINKFSNAAEAQRQTGVQSSSILRVCKGQRKTAGGYIWSYEKF